jgi:hypothetical protein
MKHKPIDDYKVGEEVELLMSTAVEGVEEWRKGIVKEIRHVSANRTHGLGLSHPAYNYLMVEVVRTYCKGEPNNLTFYDKLNTEGVFIEKEIRSLVVSN